MPIIRTSDLTGCVVTHWYGPPMEGFNIYCVAYYRDPWNFGLTYSHREYWFPW